jgi:subtilisin family serine protease/subtilisin-like proprotein convertase family protein
MIRNTRRYFPLHLEYLEDRTVPAGSRNLELPPGFTPTLDKPQEQRPLYTSTEVMVQVQGVNGLSILKNAVSSERSSVKFNWEASKQILSYNNSTLLEVSLGAGTTPKQAVAYLGTFKDVQWVEPNYIYQGADPREYTPNDPSYGSQYHHTLMQNNLAWDTSLGSPSVRVAVLDDGVAVNHPDLNANIWVNPGETPGNGIDDDNNGYIDDLNGWDFSSGDNNPNPVGSDTHGTHVAGIAAGRTDNFEGIAGVAGNGTIVPVRWYDGATWTASMVASSYAYGIANGIKIFNASYNFDGWVGNATVDAALTAAYNSGALLFNSAGNNGQLNPPRQVFDQAIFIVSTTATDAKSDFSNYGYGADLSAPGSGILSTVTSNSGTQFDYEFFDGTSMATPNAAGVAMLVWSQNPTWTRDQVIARMVGLADDISAQNAGIENELGGGRVNSYKASRSDLFALNGPRVKRLSGLPAEGAGVNIPPTSFDLDFRNVLDTASVTASQFELRGDGADNTFNTADDVLIPISLPSGFSYKIGTNRFSFSINGGMAPDTYRFSALSGSGGLKDPFGTELDGNGNGVAGDAYTRTFIINAPSLAGSVFHDVNGNGALNVGEPSFANQRVYLDANNNGIFDNNAQTFASGTVNLPVPDNNTAWTSSAITVSGTGIVGDINVLINATQTWAGDFQFRLLGPNGTIVNLITNRGSSGDNFVNTVLDDQAAVAISAGTAPFTGSFRPEQSLSAFNGISGNGIWTLQVRDTAGGDTGMLQNWSITVGSPEANVLTDANGYFRFFALAAGSYNVKLETPAAHNYTTTSSYNPNLPSNGFIDNLNFGLAQQNAVYGTAYDDQNGNGSQGGAEPGLPNWRVYLDRNLNGVYDAGIANTGSGTVNVNVPDNNAAWTTVPLVVSGLTGTILDVNVTFNATQTYVGDMEFRLVGPDNVTTVNLITRRGGSGQNFVSTTLDDQAAASISSGSAPFTGSFRPEQVLSAFNGQNPNGTWRLQARDMAGGDVCTVQDWTITVTDSTAEPTTLSNSSGGWVLGSMTAGNFLIRQVQQPGWLPISPSYGNGLNGTISAGQSLFGYGFGLQADAVAPAVSSIVRTGSNPTNASSVQFTVTYTEAVVGVGSGNFSLTTVGLAGASITSVVGSGNTYTVTVNTGTGDGTVRLNQETNTGITDLAFNALTGGVVTGETYTIDKTVPAVTAYRLIYGNNLAYNLIGSSRFTVPWQITAIEATFSEPVGGNINSLLRTNGSLPISSFSGAGTSTLRWTLQNSMTADRVFSQLQASGGDAVLDTAGNLLGSGTNFAQNFNVLYGDVNGDGFVSSADAAFINNLIRNAGPYNSFADLNGDGVVNAVDFQIARGRIGSVLPA